MRATEFRLQRVETDRGPLALITMDNGEDWQKPTTLGRAAFETLARALSETHRRRGAERYSHDMLEMRPVAVPADPRAGVVPDQ